MKLEVQIKMNPSLYLRDPEQSELGKNIIKFSIELIHKFGFESFTFKKLALKMQSKVIFDWFTVTEKSFLSTVNSLLLVSTYTHLSLKIWMR